MFKSIWLTWGLAILLPAHVQAALETAETKPSCQYPTQLIAQYPQQELSTDEISHLLYLRGVEKVAYDVYDSLSHRWQYQHFSNLEHEESAHQDLITTLLAKYQIADPYIAHSARGVYQEQALLDVFSLLVSQGLPSFASALQVSVMIEEFEIKELQRLLVATDNTDVQFVYQNLLKDSRNQLRTFITVLRDQNQTYTPQYLTSDSFQQIVDAPKELDSIYDDKGKSAAKPCPVKLSDSRESYKYDDDNDHKYHKYDDDDDREHHKYDDDDDDREHHKYDGDDDREYHKYNDDNEYHKYDDDDDREYYSNGNDRKYESYRNYEYDSEYDDDDEYEYRR